METVGEELWYITLGNDLVTLADGEGNDWRMRHSYYRKGIADACKQHTDKRRKALGYPVRVLFTFSEE